uniref:Uncharacterized protein n=1 Tax=viral metagenome TaxID=1070528 RepID=A0A6H1ZPB8_9ZZZZ
MPAGRPKKILDYKIINDLASIFCTQEEIAHILGVAVDTLQRDKDFSGIYKKGLETAKSSLRRAQYKKAIDDGNPAMQIWLGKQYLGQREPKEYDISQTNWTTQMKIEGLDGSVI